MNYILRIYGWTPPSDKVCLLEARFPSYRKAFAAMRTHCYVVDRKTFRTYTFSIIGPRCGKQKELKHGPLWEHQS